jgi:hypothetical protein
MRGMISIENLVGSLDVVEKPMTNDKDTSATNMV